MPIQTPLDRTIHPAVIDPLVDRFFTRPIAGRTLATFKAIAEALQSDTLAAANPSS